VRTSVKEDQLGQKAQIGICLDPHTIGIDNLNFTFSAGIVDGYKTPRRRNVFFTARIPIIKGGRIYPFFCAVSFLAHTALLPVCYQGKHLHSFFFFAHSAKLRIIHRSENMYLVGRIRFNYMEKSLNPFKIIALVHSISA